VTDHVATHLRSVSRTADGAHHAVLLVPTESLGQVRVQVRMDAGTVEVLLRGGHAAATDALRDALPELRRSLTDSGLTVGRTDISDGAPDARADSSFTAWSGFGSHASATRGADARASRRTASAPVATDAASAVAPVRLGSTSTVDVLA
jgi:hypothetical protein